MSKTDLAPGCSGGDCRVICRSTAHENSLRVSNLHIPQSMHANRDPNFKRVTSKATDSAYLCTRRTKIMFSRQFPRSTSKLGGKSKTHQHGRDDHSDVVGGQTHGRDRRRGNQQRHVVKVALRALPDLLRHLASIAVAYIPQRRNVRR